MHGRVKVKTTEQQEKERKIERTAKLKAYRQAMSTILSRRDEGHKDATQLKATAQVLQSNPDITTLWNIRKEVLLDIFKSDESASEKDTILAKELELTQSCLMVNPKSYGAWYHRTWSLQQMVNPNWNKELALCDRYLKLDERNFHCWDYRKWVASQAKVSCQNELEFTMEKIGENFSNYSAWHYRSKLLPILYPGHSAQTIQEDKVHSELDLVQNAAFTDPEDSSAWFYHTWLLGKEEERVKIVFCALQSDTLTLSLTKPVQNSQIVLKLHGEAKESIWTGVDDRFDSLWVTRISRPSEGKIQVSLEDQEVTLSLEKDKEESLVKGDGWKSLTNRFVNPPNQKTKEVLKQALENCSQLLELEPDSKWTLYTKALILLALESQTNHQEVLSCLEKLKMLDTARANYYSDVKNRLESEYLIEREEWTLLGEKYSESNVAYHRQYILPAAFRNAL
eukprot:TRINITY_DN1323_c0_g1_i13.p1 TRINITY_DN1323_c0_g1~~TRINITY_DN1323_c0_g1_i13.p1  ORF type:complete len:466 (+),score=75.15 TRINITY_DN1323_c0_g1_i13:41-1399(+)